MGVELGLTPLTIEHRQTERLSQNQEPMVVLGIGTTGLWGNAPSWQSRIVHVGEDGHWQGLSPDAPEERLSRT